MPGKFERAPRYAEFYWGWALDGGDIECYESKDGYVVSVVSVEEEDLDKFPELAGVKRIYVWEDELGFVYATPDKRKAPPKKRSYDE